MNEYVIITDSSCDLPAALVEELDIHVVPLAFIMEGETYWSYPDNREMSPEDFYARVVAGAMPTTNAVNVGQATDAIEPFLKEGKDVLVLGFSSGLSTTYNSFQIAANDLAEHYPDRKVYTVDTLCASLGQGMLVYQAANLRKEGMDIDALRAWAEEARFHQCHWFTVDDLYHLKRGGRVSAATALVGTMLQIKPILHMDNEGHLINVSKARGRKASLKALAAKIGELAVEPEKQVMFISHSVCPEDAQFLANEMMGTYGAKQVIISNIGPVIGAHTGVGCVAIFFTGKER